MSDHDERQAALCDVLSAVETIMKSIEVLRTTGTWANLDHFGRCAAYIHEEACKARAQPPSKDET